MTNAGYDILMMEEFNSLEHLGIALARKVKVYPTPDEEYDYVTWEYRLEGKEPVFFWGHYIGHRDAAYADYHKRLHEEYATQVRWRVNDED